MVGANAQGKTSVLEAIYYLATSRSPHITADRQLISWMAEKEPLPHARLVLVELAVMGAPLRGVGKVEDVGVAHSSSSPAVDHSATRSRCS